MQESESEMNQSNHTLLFSQQNQRNSNMQMSLKKINHWMRPVYGGDKISSPNNQPQFKPIKIQLNNKNFDGRKHFTPRHSVNNSP